jgi:hypothetical protein
MSDMLPRPKPREPFKRALRAQLMAQASTTLVRRETVWTRFQRGWMRPSLALAAVALLLIAGTGKAAADSLPGDAAFALKRAAEQVQLAFAIDDTTRLRLLAEQADHRLAELTESIAARRPTVVVAQREYASAVAQLTQKVDDLRSQKGVSDDRKNAAEDLVDDVHLKHSAVLRELKNQGSVDDQEDIDRAKDESDKLHASDRPARTADPSTQPERARTPQPTRTVTARTPEPARTAEPTDQQAERTETPQPRPEPTATGGGRQLRTPTPSPTPTIRR